MHKFEYKSNSVTKNNGHFRYLDVILLTSVHATYASIIVRKTHFNVIWIYIYFTSNKLAEGVALG
jgi:hypothetical protein